MNLSRAFVILLVLFCLQFVLYTSLLTDPLALGSVPRDWKQIDYQTMTLSVPQDMQKISYETASNNLSFYENENMKLLIEQTDENGEPSIEPIKTAGQIKEFEVDGKIAFIRTSRTDIKPYKYSVSMNISDFAKAKKLSLSIFCKDQDDLKTALKVFYSIKFEPASG